jgi:hypothetical protein
MPGGDGSSFDYRSSADMGGGKMSPSPGDSSGNSKKPLKVNLSGREVIAREFIVLIVLSWISLIFGLIASLSPKTLSWLYYVTAGFVILAYFLLIILVCTILAAMGGQKDFTFTKFRWRH